MSEIVKTKMKDTHFPELERFQLCNDLLGKIDTIIWTMKSSNIDTLESLVAYIRAHAGYFGQNLPILNVRYVYQPWCHDRYDGEKDATSFWRVLRKV